MDSGGVRVASGGQMAGLCMVVAWHYKMAALQVLGTITSTKWKPRVVFHLTTLQKQQQHHLQTKAACTHPRDTLKVLDNPAVGKGVA